jgi:hypothetical protein
MEKSVIIALKILLLNITKLFISTPTANEHIAAVKIQTALRGFYTRQLFHSRIPGKTKNLQITENLRKSLNLVELNVHENALYLFRYNIII